MCKMYVKYFNRDADGVWKVTLTPDSKSPWSHLQKIPECVFVIIEYNLTDNITINDIKKTIYSNEHDKDFLIKSDEHRLYLHSLTENISMIVLGFDNYISVSIKNKGYRKLPAHCISVLKTLKNAF